MNYEEMSREDLISHVTAYAESLHKLSSEVMGFRILFGSLSEARRKFPRGIHAGGRGILSVPERVHPESDEGRYCDGVRSL